MNHLISEHIRKISYFFQCDAHTHAHIHKIACVIYTTGQNYMALGRQILRLNISLDRKSKSLSTFSMHFELSMHKLHENKIFWLFPYFWPIVYTYLHAMVFIFKSAYRYIQRFMYYIEIAKCVLCLRSHTSFHTDTYIFFLPIGLGGVHLFIYHILFVSSEILARICKIKISFGLIYICHIWIEHLDIRFNKLPLFSISVIFPSLAI